MNVTVDDQLGDRTTGLLPEYLPNDGTWHVGSPTEDCPTCKIKPSTLDLSQIHEQTWHDATHSPPLTPATVTVHFNGSAVYVFNILPNTLFNTTTFVNITFTIDGEDAGIFTRSPDSSSTILYNQLVYQNVALQDGPHTLVMTAGGDTKSLFLFDYLLYTTQGNDSTTTSSSPVSTVQTSLSTSTSTSLSQSPSESTSHTPVGAIVGGVVGGVAILLTILAAALLLRKRRSLRSTPTRIEARTQTTANRHGGEALETDGFLVSPSAIFPSSEPSMRSLDGSGPFASVGTPRSFPSYASHGPLDPHSERASGPGPSPDALHPQIASPTDAAAVAGAAESPTPSTDQWSSKRRMELTRRLENLQRTRSILSSSEPPYTSSGSGPTEYSMGSGTQRAMGELEAEIAELRGALATLSARLAESAADGGERGPRESLPAYAE